MIATGVSGCSTGHKENILHAQALYVNMNGDKAFIRILCFEKIYFKETGKKKIYDNIFLVK